MRGGAILSDLRCPSSTARTSSSACVHVAAKAQTSPILLCTNAPLHPCPVTCAFRLATRGLLQPAHTLQLKWELGQVPCEPTHRCRSLQAFALSELFHAAKCLYIHAASCAQETTVHVGLHTPRLSEGTQPDPLLPVRPFSTGTRSHATEQFHNGDVCLSERCESRTRTSFPSRQNMM